MQRIRRMLVCLVVAGCTPIPTPPPSAAVGVEPGGVVELPAIAGPQAVTVAGPGRLYEIRDQAVVFTLDVQPDTTFPTRVIVPSGPDGASLAGRYLFATPRANGDRLPTYDGGGKCPRDVDPHFCGVLCIKCQPCCIPPPHDPNPIDPTRPREPTIDPRGEPLPSVPRPGSPSDPRP